MPSQILADQRRTRLSELVRQHGFAALPDLANELEVSESTVRRDLDYLEETGVARRTHGGACYTGPSPKLPHFDHRQSVQWDRKRQIAAAAGRLVEDGDTILLDGGSTTYELAQVLVDRPLQVVTNSLPVATLISAYDNVDLVLIGGYIHSRTGVSLGPYANEMLAELNVRRAILSVAGINDRWYYNGNSLLVETERAMMKTADEVIVVADSTKFGRTSLARLCELGDIDVLVTDDEIDDQWKTKLTESGVRVIAAGSEGNEDKT